MDGSIRNTTHRLITRTWRARPEWSLRPCARSPQARGDLCGARIARGARGACSTCSTSGLTPRSECQACCCCVGIPSSQCCAQRSASQVRAREEQVRSPRRGGRVPPRGRTSSQPSSTPRASATPPSVSSAPPRALARDGRLRRATGLAAVQGSAPHPLQSKRTISTKQRAQKSSCTPSVGGVGRISVSPLRTTVSLPTPSVVAASPCPSSSSSSRQRSSFGSGRSIGVGVSASLSFAPACTSNAHEQTE